MPRPQGRLAELGHRRTPWQQLGQRPVAMLLRMPWPLFLLALATIYLLEVLLFALIFQLDAAGLQGQGPMGLPASVAFALQNLFVASLSAIEVSSPFCFLVGALELVVGLITTAVITGLVFLRFLQVDSPLRFSRVICLSHWQGGHLFCRFISRESHHWLNVSYSLFCFIDQEIEPGVMQRRVLPLPLLNEATPQLHRTATLCHRLSPDSPLVQLGWEGLSQGNAALMALVEGTDEVSGSPLLQVQHYGLESLRPGHVFRDLVVLDASGRRRVDDRQLDHIQPVMG